jgi:hypothetical protein
MEIDPLRAVRGIVLGLIISAFLWAIIGCIVWLILK